MLISLSMVIRLLAVIVEVIAALIYVIIDNLSKGPCCKSIKT